MEPERRYRNRNTGSWIVVISIVLVATANGAIGPAAEEVVDNVFSDLGQLLQDMGNDPPDATRS